MAKLGEAEVTRWMAFYELEQEDMDEAIAKAKEEANRGR